MTFTEVVLGAIGYVNYFKRQMAKALLFPFLVVTIMSLVEFSEPSKLIALIWVLLTMMVQTIFAITTHRMILMGPGSVPEWGIVKWTIRESLFVLHVVGLSLLTMMVSLIAFIPIAGWILAVALCFWMFGRLSLVFPAIAINQGVSFKLSWKLTKQHQLLMFLVVIVFPAILMAPTFIVELLPHIAPIGSILMSFTTIFTVAALSVSYKVICKDIYES